MRGSVNVPGPGVAKMATGSYTGTGGDQTLTFDFVPKLICIRSQVLDGSDFTSQVDVFIIGGDVMFSAKLGDGSPELILLGRPDEKSITLYRLNNAEHLFSREGKEYHYFAIGE